jgi:hypothetical protein
MTDSPPTPVAIVIGQYFDCSGVKILGVYTDSRIALQIADSCKAAGARMSVKVYSCDLNDLCDLELVP